MLHKSNGIRQPQSLTIRPSPYVSGCAFVIHVACPALLYHFEDGGGEEDGQCIERTVQGTLTVLRAAAAGGVKVGQGERGGGGMGEDEEDEEQHKEKVHTHGCGVLIVCSVWC